MDIFSNLKEVGVANIASTLGLEVLEGKTFSPCPVCGAVTRHTKRHDKRQACVIVQSGNGWLCLQCDAKGDSVDLAARLANGGKRPASAPEWREALRKLPSALTGAFGAQGAITPLPYPRTALESSPRPLPRPPYAEVRGLWERSYGVPPVSSHSWLAAKFPKYSIQQIVDSGIVRFMPKDADVPWWPWRHGYMAMLAFDHHGLIQSIHGRMLGEPEEGRPKSRFPKGYSASGLVLANKAGASWLRGKGEEVDTVVIAEGLTSTLATSMALRNRRKLAVFGYTSGSQACIKEMPWNNQTVIVITDNDKAGNLYAEKVLSVLPNNINVRRGHV